MRRNVWYWGVKGGKWFWKVRVGTKLSRAVECCEKLAARLGSMMKARLAARRAQIARLSRHRRRAGLLAKALATIVLFAAPAAMGGAAHAGTIDIQTVTVWDPGNAPDTAVMNDQTTGYGAVGYKYSIGKYDVTQSQYTTFLDAKAATDTYGLYSQYAPTDVQNGIVRSGSAGGYTYQRSA